jgi:hypothetical protein
LERLERQNHLKMHFPYRLAVGLKPLNRLLQSVAQAMASLEVEELLGPADVKTSAWLAVRLGGIPLNRPGKPHLRGDDSRKITDRDFFTCSEIDG